MKFLLNRIVSKLIKLLIYLNKKKYQTVSLGSKYGEWTIHKKISDHPVLISCGVGEDVSFDIEFINKFGGCVYLIDPTPRSILHYEKIKKRFGKKEKISYSKDGNQSVYSYNLKNISSINFKFIAAAIWVKKSKLKFFKPKNKNYVSHSAIKNNFTSDNFIIVKAIDILTIIKRFKINKIDIIKLDIEDAEILIIQDLFKKNVYPEQIIFEFGQLKQLNFISIFYLLKFFLLISKYKYDFFYNDIKNNFSIKKQN